MFALAKPTALGLASSPNPAARIVYRFDCPVGCSPQLPILCNAILQTAILDACGMAMSVARKLGARPPDPTTAKVFHSIFGHDPWDPFPGTWNIASGDLAGCELRMVEDTLRSGNVLYRCDPCTAIRNEPPESTVLDVHAIAIPAQNTVLLCPSFWHLPGILKAGVLLHEVFHLRFHPFFRHDGRERRQNSAYCFEVFTLSAMRHPPDPLAISKCAGTPMA